MSEYISIDFSKQGVWLDMAIDDLGSSRYWMTIEGEEVELTEKQYRVLMEQRVEAYKASTEAEQERIIKLLESKLCSCLDLPDDHTFADREELMKHMNCSWEAMMIEYHVALIKGEQK